MQINGAPPNKVSDENKDQYFEVNLRGAEQSSNKFENQFNLLKEHAKNQTSNSKQDSNLLTETQNLLPDPEDAIELPALSSNRKAAKRRFEPFPKNWPVTCDSSHTCQKGGVENGQDFSEGYTLYCSNCTLSELEKMESYHYCKECQISFCMACTLVRAKVLQEKETLPFNSFEMQKINIEARPYWQCMSPYVMGEDIPEEWLVCESGLNCKSPKEELWHRQAYNCPQNGFHLCLKCLHKWKQFKFSKDVDYTIRNVDLMMQEQSQAAKIVAIKSVEEENKVLQMDFLAAEDIYKNEILGFLEKHIRQNCCERIQKLQPYVMKKEDFESKSSPMLLEKQPDYGQFSIHKKDLQLLQFENQYIPMIAFADCAYDVCKVINKYLRFYDPLKNFDVKKEILLEHFELRGSPQDLQEVIPSYLKFRSSIFYYKRFYEIEKKIKAEKKEEKKKEEKKEEEEPAEEPTEEALAANDPEIKREYLHLFKLNLKTMEETKVDGFDLEEKKGETSNFIFNKVFGGFYAVYWFEKGLGEEFMIQREGFSEKKSAIMKGKTMSVAGHVTSIFVIDVKNYEIVWQSNKDLDNHRKLKEQIFKNGHLLENAVVEEDYDEEEEEDDYDSEYDDEYYEGGDKSKEEPAVSEIEINFLKLQTILKCRMNKTEKDTASKSKVCLYLMKDLTKPIKELEIPKSNQHSSGFFRYDQIVKSANVKEVQFPNLKLQESSIFSQRLDRKGTKKYLEEQTVEKSTFIFFQVYKQVHVDYYPNEASLNEDNIEKKNEGEFDANGDEKDIDKFLKIGENIRVYPDQPSSDFQDDVQEIEITMKFPGEDYEKTYTQYYLFNQYYTGLLYPCFDKEYCFDLFGNESKAGQNENEGIQKVSLQDKILEKIEATREAEIYVRQVNETTTKTHNRQLIAQKNKSEILQAITKSKYISQQYSLKDIRIFVRSGRFTSTVFLSPSSLYDPTLMTLTYFNNNDVTQRLDESTCMRDLKENPQRYKQLIDRWGVPEAKAKEFGRISSIQANIMQFEKSLGTCGINFLLNSAFENIFYSSTEIQVSNLDNKQLDSKYSVASDLIIESPSKGYGAFSKLKIAIFYKQKEEEKKEEMGKEGGQNKKKPKEYTDEIDETKYFEVLSYLRSNTHYIFMVKYDYSFTFFVVKTIQEVKMLENNKDDALLTQNTPVFSISQFDSKAPIKSKFKVVYNTARKYMDEQEKFASSFIVQKLRDMKFTSDHLPVIYHDYSEIRSLVFISFNNPKDIQLQIISLNSNKQINEYSNGYQYLLCRSSDRVYSKKRKHLSFTKYQVAIPYKCEDHFNRCQINEYSFIENFKTREQDVKLTGVREIILSKQQNKGMCEIQFSLCPFYGNKGRQLQGTQIFARDYYEDYSHTFVIYDEQFGSLQYKYKSNIVKFGYQKFFDGGEKNYKKFFLLLNTCMRSRFIFEDFFDTFETRKLLDYTNRTMLNMAPFKFDKLILFSPDQTIGKENYFRGYEILNGKNLIDIHIKDPKVVFDALQVDPASVKSKNDCLLMDLLDQNNDSTEALKKFSEGKLYDDNCRLSQDFNFMTNLERSFSMKAYKSAELLLEMIFNLEDKYKFQPLIMRVLPLVLQQKNVSSIFSFLNHDDIDDWKKGCSLEVPLSHQELPLFSQSPLQMFKIHDYWDITKYIQELVDKIKDENLKEGGALNFDIDESLTVREQIIANLKKVEQAQQRQVGDTFTLQHSFIDFRYLILGEKMRSDFSYPIEFNDFYLSHLINQVQESEFYDQDSVRNIIDFQFQTTKFVAAFGLWFYILLFMFPFLFTILTDENPTDGGFDFHAASYLIGLLPQLFFFMVEMVQIKQQGLDYFQKNYWNIFDLMQFPTYILLFLFHNYSLLEDEGLQQFIAIILRLLLVFEGFIKIQYFIRIYESYGFLVQMVLMTMYEVIPFTVYLLMWICLWAVSYQLLKVKIEEDPDPGDELSYPFVNTFIKFMIQSYRNSIGDIDAPDYEDWYPVEGEDSSGVIVQKYTMINLIWLVWLGNQFVNLIILLNFLIAVISQTYEKVISQQQTHNYLHKSELNEEVFQMGSMFKRAMPFKIIAFSIDKESLAQESDEWLGLIQSLKKHISFSNDSQTKKVGQMVKKHFEMIKTEIEESKKITMASQEKISVQLTELMDIVKPEGFESVVNKKKK